MWSATLALLASGSAVYAQGQWGDDYDGDGPGYVYYYGYGSQGGDDAFGDGFGSGIGIDVDTASNYRTIHGVLAALAFVGLFPIGAILMRVVPGRLSWIVHGIVQLIAYVIYIAGAALGIYLVRMVRIPPNGRSLLSIPQANAHPIIGLVVLAILFFQPALGWIHHLKYKRLGRRTAWSYAHLWIGRLAITLGIVNGGLGLGLARASHSATVAYSVIAAIMWLLWVVAAVVGERRRRNALTPPAKRLNEPGPSPPYTPGPLYGGPPVTEDTSRGIELGAIKAGRRGSSVSSLLPDPRSRTQA
ncbi:hypothetical protein AB5N19_07180 [Seiridium cardinale]